MKDTYRILQKIIILSIVLMGLPWVGMLLSGTNMTDLMEFPPKTRYVEHSPFSWPVFLGLALFSLMIVLPLIRRAVVFRTEKPNAIPEKGNPIPWWGVVGLVTGFISWILAWTRFPWFSCLQLHTFLPLWLSYILVVNALTVRRKGDCLMTRNPPVFLSIFLLSMFFWWFFEYLNRFVQNWYYLGVTSFSPLEYVLMSSASFSTVLPAVLCTREFLLTFPLFERAFGSFIKIKLGRSRFFAGVFLILSGMGLAFVGAFPDFLFPLLWVSPLVIVVSLQAMINERHILSDLVSGRWTLITVSAASALVCGFFWEMWNYFSMAKWVYAIPYVQTCHLFEMPLLGYMGYLPFGLECAVIGDMIFGIDDSGSGVD